MLPPAFSPFACLLALALGALAGAPAAAALIRQGSDGLHRTCAYPPAFSSRGRGGVRDRIVRIGAGEPCPNVYPGEPRPTATVVPSMATLKEEAHEGGRLICVYSYLDRDYRRPATGGRCTMTPN